MAYARQLLAMLLWLATFHSVWPQDERIFSDPEAGGGQLQRGLDVGRVDSCERPRTSYCTEVEYEVPAAVSWLTEVIEYEIRNTVDPQDSEDDLGTCRDVLKETLCRKKFPR